jgi:uncharacterized surface protein with fasciclin (FAS1) repeats
MKREKLPSKVIGILFLMLVAFSFASCIDEFLGEDDNRANQPDWLNESIYDYLVKDGRYNYFLSLIDSVGYKEVLQKTGNKTLFVANDSTFDAFLKERGTTFEQLSTYDRQAILFSSTLDNTYLLEMLSRKRGNPPVEGEVMRRTTDWETLMALQWMAGDSMPDNAYWERIRAKAPLLIAKDDHSYTMIHFLSAFLQSKGVTDSDFEILTGRSRNPDDVFIFDAKVLPNPALPQQYGDIACKNGYVNEVDRVLYPRDNMAEYIRKNTSTQSFNSMLERFSAPEFSSSLTTSYRNNVDPNYTDSVFAKRFFSELPSPRFYRDPVTQQTVHTLRFDPGNNAYSTGGDVQIDMAAMFVPTDAAWERYFYQGQGAVILSRYGSIDAIPTDVLQTLLNNHLWTSFISTIPSRFSTIVEPNDAPLNIKVEDIISTEICSNGVVYLTDKVYSPSEFTSVIAPVTFNNNATIIQKGIKDTNYPFDVYLNSMVNKFSFFAYTDELLTNYIYTASIAKDRTKPEGVRFINVDNSATDIRAVVYDPIGGTPADSIRGVLSAGAKGMLKDIIDNNIVLGLLEQGKEYYATKGGATVRILPGTGLGRGMKIQGRSEVIAEAISKDGQNNGETFFLNQIVQPPLYSVYHILSDTINNPQFSEFFYLCTGAFAVDDPNNASDPKVSNPIFVAEGVFKGANQIVSFFNTYNYTVYVPTNEKVVEYVRREFNAAPDEVWDKIYEMDDPHEKAAAAKKLYSFLLYHFQDNSVYIRGGTSPQFYETALLNSSISRFRRLYVDPSVSGTLKVYSETDVSHTSPANVITTTPAYYNIMARDCQFRNVNSSDIVTSSFAVIHQIDKVLEY